MRRDEALSTLKAYAADFRRMGVTAIYLFGSIARDEARLDSDVDLLIDLDHSPTLFELARIRLELEKRLGTGVDLGLRDCVREPLRDRIYAEAIRAA